MQKFDGSESVERFELFTVGDRLPDRSVDGFALAAKPSNLHQLIERAEIDVKIGSHGFAQYAVRV